MNQTSTQQSKGSGEPEAPVNGQFRLATLESDNNKADAEFIVRACNSHDALVGVCKKALGLARYATEWNSSEIKPEPHSFAPMTRALWHQLNVALAAASEKGDK